MWINVIKPIKIKKNKNKNVEFDFYLRENEIF